MRILVLVVGFLIVTTPAWAKPKVAVAPFKGDKGNKVADAIAESLAGSVKVTDPKATGKVVDKLALGKELDAEEATKLAKKLDVDAIVQGKLDKDGKTQTLKVAVFQRGKEDVVRFTVQFKTVNDKFREDVSKLIVKKIDGDAKPARVVEDDPPKRRVAEPDDDEGKVRKKKRRAKDDDDDEPADGHKRVAARFDVGGFGGVRRLTYSSSMAGPPRVGTRNTAVRLEGEVYPFAFGGKTGGTAGLGFAGEFQKTLGLSIKIPAGSVPINQGQFSIGARYRIATGAADFTLGLDLKKQHYIADRSGLQMPTALDAPDVDYTILAPGVGVAKAATPKVAVWGRAGGMLFLDAGPIQNRDQYGAATLFGFDLKAGTDIGFTERIGLRLAAGFSNIIFKFKGNGTMAAARGVVGAADRDFGLAATLGITY